MPLNKRKPDLDLTESAPSGGFEVPSGRVTLGQMLQDPERYSEELASIRSTLAEAAAKPNSLGFALRAISELVSEATIARFAEYRALGERAAETVQIALNAYRPPLGLSGLVAQPSGFLAAIEAESDMRYLMPRNPLEQRLAALEAKDARRDAEIARLRAELFLNAIVMWPPVDDDGAALNPGLN